jgi:predicted ATPase/DNA-binding SARP family transcriptional activator
MRSQSQARDGTRKPSPANTAIPALRVRTLGRLAAWRGATDLAVDAWRPRTVAALFTCLLSAPGQRLRRDDLAELLWPEGEIGIGRRNLRVAIHHLRRHLDQEATGQSYLRQEGEFLCLTPTPNGPAADWLDAVAFERAATMALAGMDRAACREALALYGGDYLPEYATEEWALARRDALAEHYLDLLLHLAALAEREGVLEEAARCLQRVLETDPCREVAGRALMRVQLADGRHDEAVRTYRELAQALRRDLGLVPDGETEAQYRIALEGRLRAGRARTNLPASSTSFVGREDELAALTAMLASAQPAAAGRDAVGPRLVTVVGAGGCGKSRLAVELGRALLSHYPDGVWLIELAALVPGDTADPMLVARQACAALGLREEGEREAQAVLASYLAPRSTLLILDNCEHLVAACATLVNTLLGRCPDLRILATSREALSLLGEHVWWLASLETPDEQCQADLSLRDLLSYGAVRLFVERARAARPGFALAEGNRRAVTAICAQLDGIPLAIELAATRLGFLGVAEVAARLGDRFRLLTGGNRGALPRHQTLQAVLDWSYDLLDDGERRLLRALAVFAGGWTPDAAEVVCADGASDIQGTLAGLLGKSLVQVHAAGEEMARHRLLETVRAYAMQRLAAAGELVAVRERHARWCQGLADEAALGLVGPDQGDWLARLDAEHDNLRAALRWALEHDEEHPSAASPSYAKRHEIAMQLAVGIWRFWLVRGHVTEGRSWMERLIQVDSTAEGGGCATVTRAAVLAAAAVLSTEQGEHGRAADLAGAALAIYRELGDQRRCAAAFDVLATTAMRQGDYGRAAALYEESLAVFRALGQQRSIATVLNNRGMAARNQGDYELATELYEESLAIKRDLGDVHGIAVALNNLGDVALDQGDVRRARALFERSLASFREQGGQWGIALLLTNLGNVARAEGEYAQALSLYRESLALYREMDNRMDTAECLAGLAAVCCAMGDPHRAARLLAAATAGRAAHTTPLSPRDRAESDRTRAAVHAALGEAMFAAAWAEGRAMAGDGAIAYALTSGS